MHISPAKLRPSGPNADLPPAFGQPMIVDMNGDMMPDLFGVSAAQPTKRSSWISSASGSTWTLFVPAMIFFFF
jgi:hypothetical protein